MTSREIVYNCILQELQVKNNFMHVILHLWKDIRMEYIQSTFQKEAIVSKQGKRLEFVDCAKGIGIILVVLGHTRFPYLRNIIYSFHMPLFFILSGYLFQDRKLEVSFSKYLIKRLNGLYLPFLKFSIFYLLFNNFFVSIGFLSSEYRYEGAQFLKVLIENLFFLSDSQFSGTFWFIRNLFGIEIIMFSLYKICRSIVKKKENAFYFGAVCIFLIIGYICSEKRIIPTLANIYVGMAFFLVGYLVRNRIPNVLERRNLLYFGIFSIFAIGPFLKVDMVVNSYSNFWLFLITGTLGSLAVVQVCKMLPKLKINNFFEYIGKNSLYILCFHFLAFKVVLMMSLYLRQLNFSYLQCFIERPENVPIFVYNPKTDFWIYWLGGVILPLMIPMGKQKLVYYL